jgi:hypothetical protein
MGFFDGLLREMRFPAAAGRRRTRYERRAAPAAAWARRTIRRPSRAIRRPWARSDCVRRIGRVEADQRWSWRRGAQVLSGRTRPDGAARACVSKRALRPNTRPSLAEPAARIEN